MDAEDEDDDNSSSNVDPASRPTGGSTRPKDPFTDDDDVEQPTSPSSSSSSSRGSASGNGSFGGKRYDTSRTEMDDLLDFGMRFEGARTLMRAVSSQALLGTDLAAVRVGQLVVVGIDAPSLQLWYGQAYEVKRAYFQRRDDELGSRRVDADTLGAAPPAPERQREAPSEAEEDGGNGGNLNRRNAASRAEEWELWVDLFSEEYHASPVRVRPHDVGLRTVGAEVGEALQIAVPIACFWALVGASFVLTSMSRVPPT